MNRKIIQKLIDELDKESPRLDYIRGILETLMESLPNGISAAVDDSLNKMFVGNITPMTEASILEKEAMARLKNIKDIAV